MFLSDSVFGPLFVLFSVDKHVKKWSPKCVLEWGQEEGGGNREEGTFLRRGPKAAQRRSREAQRRAREASRAEKGYQKEPK